MGSMRRTASSLQFSRTLIWTFCFVAVLMAGLPGMAQVVTVTVQGRVYDSSGAAIAQAAVTAVNAATGLSRTATASAVGDYQITLLPPGDYTVTAEKAGFQKSAKKIHLDIGAVGSLDFSLAPGQVQTQVEVQDVGEVAEPTRTMVSSVIDEQKIEDLPVNGREFIDFALLAPGVTIGNTTSGSTDVIVEPVTKLSFAGQNIHFNFIAVDGADDISTASGIQRGTPPQESVQEFRVINSDYTTEFGRATAGIVNIITKSGTNNVHGSVYEYFRNNAMDAVSILSSPILSTCKVPGDPTSGGCKKFNALHQNQFGAAIGAPLRKDRTFIFANYEGQRRSESPTYNSTVIANIVPINAVKTQTFGLPAENLYVLRDSNTDNGFIRLDQNFTKSNLYVRYFVTDGRLTNQSPLNNGFDLPSAFKNNYIRDQSVAGAFTSVLAPSWVNELRMQFAHRTFDFPVVSTQPHLEVANTFAVGVNRGNPDIYREKRFEVVDNVTHNLANHTISFGGNLNWVGTYESFPLFYPFEADFADLKAFLGTDGAVTGCPSACPDPFVIFFERFDKTTTPFFNETSVNGGLAVYQGGAIPSAIRNQAAGTLDHTYEGFYVQDKWRASQNLTINGGVRWEFETWPSGVLNTNWKDFDPRVGLAYNVGTSHNVVLRAGAGLFHGIIPSPLIMCQEQSCGGLSKYPGSNLTGVTSVSRNFEDGLNANTGLFSFASAPFITYSALSALFGGGPFGTPGQALFPNGVNTPAGVGCAGNTLAGCGFLQPATIVRFDQNHQNPYGAQASATLEFQPFKDAVVSVSGIHLRGVHLGSFYNVNQPPPGYGGTFQVHNSKGQTSCKTMYFNFAFIGAPVPNCVPYYSGMVIPGAPHVNAVPGFNNSNYSVFFEAASKWDSVYDGLLINMNKRMTNNFSFAISYTWSHSIDNGPNPSFVLIPQDSADFAAERASSADDVRHRFVGNAIFSSPKDWNVALRDFSFSMILTLQSPQYFTKYAGFDVNGDVFGNNDRVGAEPRNTFKGDSLQTVDVRLERTFPIREKVNMQFMAEAFNLTNTVNIRYFNTNYAAADFCTAGPSDANIPGCAGAAGQLYRENSPNPAYGTPSAVFNPRQVQLALRFTW